MATELGRELVKGKLTALGLGGVLLLCAACGTSPKAVNQPTGTTGSATSNASSTGATGAASSTTSPPTSTTTTTKPVAHVGATLKLTGETSTTVSVTLVKVMDPATPATSFTTPGTGKRLVAAEFTVKDVGSKAVTGDANNDATLVGSNGQTYSPTFATIGGCTNFSSGQFQLAQNESATGCVSFGVPTGVTIAKVKWSPSSGFATDFGEWVVP